MSETVTPTGVDMVAYWNDVHGRTWAEMADMLDQELGDLGLAAMEALAPQEGERIVDVGCGCGQTSLQLAARVGETGSVTGVDISAPMLAEARKRAAAAGVTQAAFVEADAQTYAFEPAALDAIYSRFGVMFFADSTAAFANLRTALKPGGRLAFVCWRPLLENAWMLVPMGAALKHLPPPVPPQPGAPGPFAFADPQRLRGILSQAGFTDVGVEPLDLPLGGFAVEESLRMALRIGPLATMLRENPETAPRAIEDIRAVLSERAVDGRVWLGGAVWIVTARNG